MKELAVTTITNVGGREGEVFNADRTFTYKIAPPDSGNAGATNPEQLFAAGYSACFNSALAMALRRDRIRAQSTVTATVTLYERASFDYVIGVVLEGHVDGLSPEETQAYLEKAHETCPYSKATRGNIEVTLRAV